MWEINQEFSAFLTGDPMLRSKKCLWPLIVYCTKEENIALVKKSLKVGFNVKTLIRYSRISVRFFIFALLYGSYGYQWSLEPENFSKNYPELIHTTSQ